MRSHLITIYPDESKKLLEVIKQANKKKMKLSEGKYSVAVLYDGRAISCHKPDTLFESLSSPNKY